MPKKLSEYWPLVWETLEALTAHYGPAIDHAAEQLGVPYGQWYGWLMAAKIFEPDPVSAVRLSARAAYTNPALQEARLGQGVTLGLLAPAGTGEYHLTNAGHAAVRQLIDTAYAAMAPLHPLPDADLERLLTLLRRLVEASLAAPEPPGKWCLRIARHYDPAGRAGMAPQLDQYLSDLVAYRDDAHLAAWKPLGVTGQEWETLTHLWHGDIVTLDDLCARHCVRRGYACDSYAVALQALIARGWVGEHDGAFRITEQGRRLRDEAEATTDRYFFAPWVILTPSELGALAELLAQARDALRPVSP
ncbi:MAG: MarR family winged helix-turn-helix transcriptional regulator [Anaerolineae bacterium]|nr:MarR family winged helix-turn-helix transcriptional regulator [Anaerolineae bacterium]